MTPDQASYIKTLANPLPHWGGMGATELSLDPRDYDIRSFPGVADMLESGVPDSVDLTSFVRGEIYNQGATGACVAYSTGHLCSIDEVIEVNKWEPVNCAEMYRRAGGTGSNGVDSRLVLQQAVDSGVPLAAGGAIKTIASYAFAPQQVGVFTQTLKAALAAGYPVVVALLLPSDFGWRSGSGAVTSGYHQICGIGYTADGYMIFVNSWGGSWPGNSPHAGVGSIRFDYLEANGNQNRYCYAYSVTALNVTPPPPPPPAKTGTLTGKVAGAGITTLASGQIYALGAAAALTVSSVTIDGAPPPPPPLILTVSGYAPNPVKSGQSFLINGSGFQGGNLTASWQGGALVSQRLSDTQIQATAPSVTTSASGPVTVRVEGATAAGPPLTVTVDSQPPPGSLQVKLYPRRRSASTVTLLAYVYRDGAPETATLTGTVANVTLETRQAQIGSWTVTGLPAGSQTITVNATSANGSGTATAII